MDEKKNRRPPPLPSGASRRTVLLGMAGVGAIGAANLSGFAYAGGWLTPASLTPERFTDRFQQVFGTHDGFRRNHAKGVAAAGYFDSNGTGKEVSKAVAFDPGRIPVMARFSLSGGMPYVADNAATVRGLGVLFKLPNGEQWRTAMVNSPVFLDKVPRGFYDRLVATKPEPSTGKPNPQKLAAFLAKYPETARAMKTIAQDSPASGIYNSTFHGLNAFWLTNRAGKTVPVRWLMVPELPAETTSGPTPNGHDYLFDGLIEKFAKKGVLRWHMVLTIGKPGDPTNDATTAWPPDRRTIDVGTLTIDSLRTEAAGNARDVNFDPLVLPDGIAPSDDPLLGARSAVYSVSFIRRSGEPKEPSDVNVAEVEHD